MEDVKAAHPTCRKDGFPMVKIDGHWECIVEYLDRCIGQQKVVDLVQRDKTTYCVFESKHELPLLCFCCGKPLIYEDMKEFRHDIQGRQLEIMSLGEAKLQDGRKVMQFALEFSKRKWLSRRLFIPVAFEAASQLRHPVWCPHKRISPKKQK